MLEPMLDWSNLQHFLALATTDSLPKAAERLGVNRTTVSRRITDLEKAFGATLFERRGRNLVLTQSGRDVLAVAEGIDGALQGLGRRVFGRDERIEGTIRVTLTSGVAKLIASDVAAFMAQHPRLIVEMNVTNSAEDLELMEADIAIRLTESPPGDARWAQARRSELGAVCGDGIGDRPKRRGAVHRYVRRTRRVAVGAAVAAEGAFRRQRQSCRCVLRTGRFRRRRGRVPMLRRRKRSATDAHLGRPSVPISARVAALSPAAAQRAAGAHLRRPPGRIVSTAAPRVRRRTEVDRRSQLAGAGRLSRARTRGMRAGPVSVEAQQL